MKLAGALVVFAMSAVAVMVFQTVQQELKLQGIKSKLLADLTEVKNKETAISELKGRVKQLKDSLSAINRDVSELQAKKELNEKMLKEKVKALSSCTEQQEAAQNQRAETDAATVKLADGHIEAKKVAETEIQKLKADILQRDKSVCAFADTTREIVRSLCGMSPKAN